MAGKEFAVFAHCASGYRELWDVVSTRKKAIELGTKVLRERPIVTTPEGRVDSEGGGVVWCEVFGPGIEESIGVERGPSGVVLVTP